MNDLAKIPFVGVVLEQSTIALVACGVSIRIEPLLDAPRVAPGPCRYGFVSNPEESKRLKYGTHTQYIEHVVAGSANAMLAEAYAAYLDRLLDARAYPLKVLPATGISQKLGLLAHLLGTGPSCRKHCAENTPKSIQLRPVRRLWVLRKFPIPGVRRAELASQRKAAVAQPIADP